MNKVISLTSEQVKQLCPKAYQKLVDQIAEDPTQTPVEDLEFWLSHFSLWSTECDSLHNTVLSHPGYSLNLQDPADDGYSNVSLVWEGEDWG